MQVSDQALEVEYSSKARGTRDVAWGGGERRGGARATSESITRGSPDPTHSHTPSLPPPGRPTTVPYHGTPRGAHLALLVQVAGEGVKGRPPGPEEEAARAEVGLPPRLAALDAARALPTWVRVGEGLHVRRLPHREKTILKNYI